MRLTVIGTGYVGLVTGACFADLGHTVWCVDVDEAKIAKLKEGVIPIYEPGLEDIVHESVSSGHLHFTEDIREALPKTDIVFIAVGTPQTESGAADLSYVLRAAREIGQCMDHNMTVVDKSTVPVGTAERVRAAIQSELDARGSDLTFEMVSNPEFLKEGAAVSDFQRPDRVVLGTDSPEAEKLMKELYHLAVFNTERFVCMDIRSAEMTKYAANAMLATKISFMNEISNICERVGADVNKVRLGIGSDSRIGFHFIYPGCGYGGCCFPKDVRALIHTGRETGYEAALLSSVDGVNEAQKRVIPAKIAAKYGEDLSGRVFALWGLAFKPNTDDMRMAPSLTIVEELTRRGAKIRACDPKAMEEAARVHFKDNPNIEYFRSKYDALSGADALILATEWKTFRNPDFEEVKQRLKAPVIFDGRNQYDREALKKLGFEYYQIGIKEGSV